MSLRNVIHGTLNRLGIEPSQLAYNFHAARKRGCQIVDRREDERNGLRINIGGTRFFKRHWRVMDYRHPTTRHYDSPSLDYNHDLMAGRPFPLAAASVAFFYSSHTLEHILDAHIPFILSEIHRCLRPGGAVRLTMPDFDAAYGAFMANDGFAMANIQGDQEHDRWRGAVRLYGESVANQRLPGWPHKPLIKPALPLDQSFADRFLGEFAAHRIGRITLAELRDLAARLDKEAFADHLTSDVTMEWKCANPQEHANWFTYEKLECQLRAAGFDLVYRSKPFESRFPEMVGVDKYWSFDHLRMETGLYVEAVKS